MNHLSFKLLIKIDPLNRIHSRGNEERKGWFNLKKNVISSSVFLTFRSLSLSFLLFALCLLLLTMVDVTLLTLSWVSLLVLFSFLSLFHSIEKVEITLTKVIIAVDWAVLPPSWLVLSPVPSIILSWVCVLTFTLVYMVTKLLNCHTEGITYVDSQLSQLDKRQEGKIFLSSFNLRIIYTPQKCTDAPELVFLFLLLWEREKEFFAS